MTIWRLVRLNFGRSPTHFGEVGIGLEQTSERVRSDTLFSAWVSTYARIFGKDGIEGLLARFNQAPDDPPFRVSSTFVYRRKSDEFIDYLPKLIESPIGYPPDDLSFAKTYRKIMYLPLSVWQRWYQGSGFNDPSDAEEMIVYANHLGDRSGDLGRAGTFDYRGAFKPYELPKVSIDRTTRATNFYHTGLIQFAWEPQMNPASDSETSVNNWSTVKNLAGLYFLLHFPTENSKLEAELRMALELLGEEGMGGERSSGAGRFEIMSWEPLPSKWQSVVEFSEGNHYGLMSLFWQYPLPGAYLENSARYALQERGGWISSPTGRQLRRKKIHMFAEGSVFPHRPNGHLADVTPGQFRGGHSVYRSGVALSIPVKLPLS
jgi:CRISPR-associated protein Csm4